MYTNDRSHRFPALVLAAGLTTAVVIGLSALAQHRVILAAPETRQVAATTRSASQAAIAQGSTAPLRIDVVATCPHSSTALQTVADGAPSKEPS
jgi:hypothetical protein